MFYCILVTLTVISNLFSVSGSVRNADSSGVIGSKEESIGFHLDYAKPAGGITGETFSLHRRHALFDVEPFLFRRCQSLKAGTGSEVGTVSKVGTGSKVGDVSSCCRSVACGV